MRYSRQSERGGALLVVLVFLGLGALLSASLLRVTTYSHRRSYDVVAQRQADYSAMAGVEMAMADIQANPERFLKAGTTWEPLDDSPSGLDFQVALTESDGYYLLTSIGGSPPHQVAYTLTLKKGGHVSDYGLALGGELGLSLTPSKKEFSVFGGPIYVEGDLYVNHNEAKGYAIYPDDEKFPVIVTGRAHIGQNGIHERDLTAEDLNASRLIVGAPPLGVDKFLVDAVAYLKAYVEIHPGGPVLIYNPDAWGLYDNPAARVVVVDGSLGCEGGYSWGNAGKTDVQKFYGTLVVKGQVCQPSYFKGLEVHGAIMAGGIALSSKQAALTIYYERDYMSPVLEEIPGSETARIELIDTDVEY